MNTENDYIPVEPTRGRGGIPLEESLYKSPFQNRLSVNFMI